MSSRENALPRRIVLGTRRSALARLQTERVATLLRSHAPGVEIELAALGTAGDRDRTTPLPELGGKGLFTADLEQALRERRIDAAVHSLKDLPVQGPADLRLAAILDRVDAGDVLVAAHGETLQELPRGARVGSSSVRRSAQLLAARPDLVVAPIRGNVETRIKKVTEGAFGATVLAAAGLLRLQREEVISERLAWGTMLPAPGQGALAVQCLADNAPLVRLLGVLDDELCRAAVTCERAFLEGLGGGCSSPVGAYAEAEPAGAGYRLRLQGVVLSPDGSRAVRVQEQGSDSTTVGRRAAERALAQGAGELLSGLSSPVGGGGTLRGMRVLVTRPQAQSGRLARELRRRAAQVQVVPLTQIITERCETAIEALQHLERYDWVVFTSANTVRVLLDELAPEASPAAGLPGKRAAAVGPATAAALRERGVVPALVAKVHTGEHLVEEVGALEGRRVLLPQGQASGRRLERRLTAAGALVERVVVYRTEATADLAALASALGAAPDLVMLTSGTGAQAFAGALERLGLELGQGSLATTRILCIGPSAAEAARAAGLPVHRVAQVHTDEGLVQAAEQLRAEQPPHATG